MQVCMTSIEIERSVTEITYMDNVVQWEQRVNEFETMSRETLPDVVERAIITEISPPAISTTC